MVRVSNSIVVLINTVLLLLGLLSLLFGIYSVVVDDNNGSHCRQALTSLLLILGGLLVTVSLLGLVGSLLNNSCFMFVYLGVMFLSILCLIGFTVFVVLITNDGAGKVFSEKELFLKEHKTVDFSHWLQNHFVKDKNWIRIKSCLIDAKVCTTGVNYKALVFFKNTLPLPAIQAGCCKPPSSCGLVRKNVTFWEVPKSGSAASDPDCLTWNNNQWKLCYDCNSCKSGILTKLRKEWRCLAIINILLLIFLVFVYSVGCCARRSNHHTSIKYIRGFA
ncbi:tetraspanin11 [Hibiscus trionum]|uniref:Tetraspanin11 n=1 Tax=Hibiscus trionum TaxID=183268 RepID=A0A9W7IJ99_HIBTR|nr:tetraspanin11 [Hibiscus trionum]